MRRVARLGRAAAILTACWAPFAWAAAPAGLAPPLVPPEPASAPPIYQLDTEMVVHNWVLCASKEKAEQLVRAREESVERALSAYADLKRSRACGQFAELRVILRERLYMSESGHDARVFGALINLADNWASAFLVYGGLPEE